jgi:uncharacterized protein (DUF433 family)
VTIRFTKNRRIETGPLQHAPQGQTLRSPLRVTPPPSRGKKLNDGRWVKNMATLDWSQCPAVESVPGRLSGAWVFRDTRMPVSAVFENLEAGATIDEIIEQFDITREQINAVLEFAARSLDPVPAPAPKPPPDAHSL